MTNLLEQQRTTERLETQPALAPEEQFERTDAIDTPQIAVAGFISAIATFVIIVVAQAAFFAADSAENQRKVILSRDLEAEQAINQQESQLGSYEWVDAKNGVVGIPIDEAMQVVVREQREVQENQQ